MNRLRRDVQALSLGDGRTSLRLPDGRSVVLDEPSLGAGADVDAGHPAFASLQRLGFFEDAPAGPQRRGMVRVMGDGACAEAAQEVLGARGVAHPGNEVAGIEPDDLLLVALDVWDVARLESINAAAHASNVHWLPAGPFEGRRLHIGPLVVPGETACYACYLARRQSNAWSPAGWAAFLQSQRDAPSASLDAPWAATCGRLAAHQAMRYQDLGTSRLVGAAWSLGADGFDVALDDVIRVPRCPACGRHERVPPQEPWMPLARA